MRRRPPGIGRSGHPLPAAARKLARGHMCGPLPARWAAACCLAVLVVGCGGRVILQDAAEGAEAGAPDSVLGASLPLEVTLTTPGDLATSAGPIAIGGSQPLAVVFSRSVVALGAGFGDDGIPANHTPFTLTPAVEGRLRWVTTYVARFDPAGGWPSDLTLEFALNENLVTFDGVPLSLEGPRSVALVTESLEMSVRTVISEQAKNFTSGLWDPFVGQDGDKLPEVPPDGVIQLEFSHGVALDLLSENLKVKEAAGSTVANGGSLALRAVVETCQDASAVGNAGQIEGETKCAAVRIEGGILPNTSYALVLEETAAYTRRAGAGRLLQAREARFAGLRPFRIPFVLGDVDINSPVLDMWLPHGLERPQEALEALRGGLILVGDDQTLEVDFTLELPNDGTLRLNASDLKPLGLYGLSVPADLPVTDRYGQPLLPSQIALTGTAAASFFLPLMARSAPPLAYFEAGHPEWTNGVIALGRGPFSTSFISGCGAPALDIYAIESTEDVEGVLDILQLPNSGSVKELFGGADLEFKIDANEPGEFVEGKFVPELFNATGTVVHESCRSGMFEKQVITETDVLVSIVSAGVIDGKGNATVWVTSLVDGTPVEGVEVMIFSTPSGKLERELLGNVTTGTDGRAIVPVEPERMLLVIKHDEKYLFLPRVSIDEHSLGRTRASLVLDRKLVRPGESLHVKGFVMDQEGLSLSSSDIQQSILSIIPPLNHTGGHLKLEDVLQVQVDEKFGTFDVEIPIPENASVTDYRIEFGPSGGPESRPSETFRVGDPRPPTVDLSVSAPFWASPESGVEVAVQAISFIGAAVSDAAMTLKWSVFDSNKESALGKELLFGALEFTTDEAGAAFPTISFQDQDELPPPGSILDVTVEWVGPTRELIEKKALVRLELADVMVNIETTVSTDIPGQEFGVRASMLTLAGVKLEPAQASVVLKSVSVGTPAVRKREPRASQPLQGEVVDKCNSADFETCRMALPNLGLFALEVCIDVENSTQQVCQRSFLGRTESSWAERPLVDFLPVGLVRKDTGVAKVGDEVTFLLENPFENAYALSSWGSIAGGRQERVVRLDDKSLIPLAFVVDENCAGDCGLSVVVAIPRQENISVVVPVSKLFDAAAPHAVQLKESVTVKQERNITVDLEFSGSTNGDVIVVPPRSRKNITVAMSDCSNVGEAQGCQPLSSQTEVTIIAVDKAVLDVLPMPLKHISSEFLLDLAAEFSYESTAKFLIAPGAVTELTNGFIRHQTLDPWSDAIRDLTPSFLTVDIDRSDEAFLASRAKFITVRPELPVVVDAVLLEADVEQVATVPVAAALDAGGEASPGDARIQMDFVSTPLFETVFSDDSGRATVEFEAPDNLGTFVVRAYATSGNGLFGSSERELIVRKDLSLTPAVPRFVRVDDVFQAGAIVTVAGGKEGDEVRLHLEEGNGSLEALGGDTITVKLDSDNQVEVRLEFRARAVGEGRFVIAAEGEGGISDALELTIPVHGQQDRVVLATSFSVGASEDGSAGFEQLLDLPQAVPGSGSMEITAGVGRLATVLSLSELVIGTNPEHECPLSASFALALSMIPAVLQKYELTGVADSDALGSGLDESVLSLVHNSLANLSSAVDTLNILTNPETGLQPWLPCAYSQAAGANEALVQNISVGRNADGIWLVGQAVPLLRAAGLEGEALQLELFAEFWRDALVRAMVEGATAARKDGGQISLELLTRARWALGPDWNPPPSTSARVARDLSMERLASNVFSLAVEDQARFVLTKLTEGGEADKTVQDVLASWTSNFRVGSRTTYISRSKGSAFPASTTGNALALLALSQAAPDTPELNKLANFVGSAPAGVRSFGGFDALEKAFTMWAVSEYDLVSNSATPDVVLVVRAGEKVLVNESFNSATLATFKKSVPWEELQDASEPLEFQASGVGEVTLAVTLMFVPRELLNFPTFQGILVERSIQMTDGLSGNASSAPLSKVPLGSVVTITVQVTNPDELGSTTVRALMPGGLEPVDPTAESYVCPLLSDDYPFSIFSCAIQETQPHVVTFRYNALGPGTQAATFRAVAATVGKWSLPPVRAFVVDEPEVMGMSAAGSIEVCSGELCDMEAQAKGPPQMKNCPGGCSGNGLCNLEEGICLCFEGYSGEACEEFVVA